MAEYEYSAVVSASPEVIYGLYSDLSSWPVWDEGIAEITIDGPFEAGSRGHLTPAGVGPLPYRIAAAEPGRGFTDETELPGATVIGTHILTPVPGGTRVTHRMQLVGPAADELEPHVWAGIVTDIPTTVASLGRHAATVVG